MALKYACADCRTEANITSYTFHNLLGAQFAVFFCSACVVKFRIDLSEMNLGQQVSCLTYLSQQINSRYVFNEK